MNKNSYIALLISFIIGIGIGIGAYFMKCNHVVDTTDHSAIQKKAELRIDSLYKSIAKKDSLLAIDSVEIEKLNFKLKVAKAKTEKKREEAAKLNVKGKEGWLISRYDSLNSDSTVTIPDTVASLAIDDLIIKDALVEELGIKDSIISKYSNTTGLLKDKVIELKEVIEEQEMINSDLGDERDDLLKELKKEKRKRIVTTIAGGSLVVLLIIL